MTRRFKNSLNNFNDAKYIVETASDGFEGMKQFNKQQFDLILLDVMMPSLNGFDVAK